jgi:hypothetical protein
MTWTMNYIEELEARIKEIEKRNIENAAKLGEAIGALRAYLTLSKYTFALPLQNEITCNFTFRYNTFWYNCTDKLLQGYDN